MRIEKREANPVHVMRAAAGSSDQYPPSLGLALQRLCAAMQAPVKKPGSAGDLPATGSENET